MMIWKGKKDHLPFDKWMVLIVKTFSPFHQRMLCAKFRWHWLDGSGKEYFISINAFLLFSNRVPFVKGVALHLNKFESPSSTDAMGHVWLKLVQWFLRRRFIYFFNVFSLFRNYLPLKRVKPFIRTNLNSLHPRILCVKFGWSWPSGYWEEVENVES